MILTDIDVINGRKSTKGKICHAIHWYPKANNKFQKNYDEYKKSYLQYWDVNNLYEWIWMNVTKVTSRWF